MPVDIRVTFGKPEGAHNLMELDYDVIHDQAKIGEFVK